ncbi:MAG: VOC family protein [Paenisporosarcina sp.]
MKHQAIPYLTFDGNAKEALDFYKEVFEGKITQIQTFGEADFPTPPGSDNRILHARFQKNEFTFMASDTFPNQNVTIGNNVSLTLEFDSEEEIQSYYDRLSKGGQVFMELQDTFWGAKYAKLQDAFGVIWDLNHEKS